MLKLWHRLVASGFLAGAGSFAQCAVAIAQESRSPAPSLAMPYPQPRNAVEAPKMPAVLGLNRLELHVDPEKPPEAGGASTLPQAIARQFSTQDLCPRERMTHFAWLEQKPRDGGTEPGLVGWWGVIKEITRYSDGWLVSVAVEPRLKNRGTLVHRIEDFYIEVYRFSGGTLRFVKAIAPPQSDWPRAITF